MATHHGIGGGINGGGVAAKCSGEGKSRENIKQSRDSIT